MDAPSKRKLPRYMTEEEVERLILATPDLHRAAMRHRPWGRFASPTVAIKTGDIKSACYTISSEWPRCHTGARFLRPYERSSGNLAILPMCIRARPSTAATAFMRLGRAS